MAVSVSNIQRTRSLDVFRGITVFGMVIVNAADLGGEAHPLLQHSPWNGCTPADLVFPAFLVILGAALGLALRAYHGSGYTAAQTHIRVLRRALTLFLLGLALNFAQRPDFAHLRVMGVLQRIALCYLLAAFILLHLKPRVQWLLATLLLLGYWAALRFIHVPDFGTLGANLPGYVDRFLLGKNHLLLARPYDGQMDPEGVLTTAPALVNVLFGAFLGRFLSRAQADSATSARLLLTGIGTLLAGLAMSHVLPLNKALWTSSFVLLSTGVAVLSFSVCYELVDVRGHVTLVRPFEQVGINAMAAYLGSLGLNTLVELALHSASYQSYLEALPEGAPWPNLSPLVVMLECVAIWVLVTLLNRRGLVLRL